MNRNVASDVLHEWPPARWTFSVPPHHRRTVSLRMPSRKGRRLRDVAAFAAPLVVGALGTIPTIPAVRGWYRTLDKPDWNPPDALFGPVWSALYLLMGIAVVLVRRADDSRSAQQLFGLQLALNLAWSYTFFGLRSPAAGAGVIMALWLAILATIAGFARRSRFAAGLMVPYLAWVTFATFLNLEIWRRNSVQR